MNSPRQTVCLNMIVKNEAPVIRRCLDSVRPFIDSWVIVDTGSTDGTQQIIRDYFATIPGELHEHPWVNFAHNRSEALVLARGKGDYVFVIDADEILEISPDFQRPQLTADSYNIQVLYGGCAYLRKQLVRNTLPWCYEGVLHEYIICHQAQTEALLPGLQTIPHHDGARARDPETYKKDAELLEKAVAEDPENKRYVFYLAQSYRDGGDFEQAINWYRRRAAMGGWSEEIWFSLYQIAQLQDRLNVTWPEVMESYLAAFRHTPDRAGPLYRIGMHYQAKGEYPVSHLFFERAKKLPRPSASRLFVEQSLYDFHVPLEYGVCCYYVGQHKEAIEANNRLLLSGKLPINAIEQVVANRRFSLTYLFPQPAIPSPVGKLRIVVTIAEAGPELDDLIESLMRQEFKDFEAIFVAGSGPNQSARIPDDPRFVYRTDSMLSAAPEDIILRLTPQNRLSNPAALGTWLAAFGDPECKLVYGQFRKADGSLGDAVPATCEEDFDAQLDKLAQGKPIAFRSELAHAETRKIFATAGYKGTRFLDATLTTDTLQSPIPNPIPTTQNLPKISCLMVTYDRLVLAKRSIRSFASQTYPNRELVIVTDGQPAFRLALERYVAMLGLDNVRFHYPEGERLSLGHLRNISLNVAQGEIICQWDDDDFSHPNRLSIQAQYMFQKNAGACLLADHLQFIEDNRLLCWVDWTIGGTVHGMSRLAPGTIMMRKDPRFRYPEQGPWAKQGEDSVFLSQVHEAVPVAELEGEGHLYLYQYHGRNTFSREHHLNITSCSFNNAYLMQHQTKLREAVAHFPIPKPVVLVGREGPAFHL